MKFYIYYSNREFVLNFYDKNTIKDIKNDMKNLYPDLFKNVKFTLKPHNLHGIKYPNYYTVFYLKSVMRAKLNSPDVPKAHDEHPDSIVLYVEIEKPTNNKSCVVM